MAIKEIFKNNTLYKPRTYTNLKTDKDAGSSTVSNDTLLIIGEASTGIKGATEGIQTFQASAIGDLVSKYTSGPIVDCALAALVSSKTPGISGPGKYMVYKTNAATQASVTLATVAPANLLIVKDRLYGQPGNNISVTVTAGSSANQKNFTISKASLDDEVLGENDALIQLDVQYTGDATTGLLTIAGASKSAKTFVATLAGDQTDGSLDISLSLSAYTMAELADYVNSQTGYSANLVATNTGYVDNGTDLDPVTASNIKAGAVDLYRLQEEMEELIDDNSVYCEAELAATPIIGVPVNIADAFLTGGAKGASLAAYFTAANTAALGKEFNAVVVAISQDAAADIALGVTDASSTYAIATVQTALDTHLRLRATVKNSKEAQGYVGYRIATKAAANTQAAALNSELLQMFFQDVKIVDVSAVSTWKQPHILAAICAGMRLGSEVGEPLTYKYINAVDVDHYVDPSTGLASGDFDPLADFEAAIINGATFVEPANNAFRVVVDNTTYGRDESFVWNRGSVIEAAFFTARSVRVMADDLFIGNKVAGGSDNSTAASLKSAIRDKLRELFGDNILSGSDDAPEGFVEDTFSVSVSNNTASVQVEIKPVNGLDFITIDFTLGSTSQSA